MPVKIEKDELSGTLTTGHEWDGIKELDTPLPKWWLFLFYATIAFSILWWILYPSWPSLTGYTKGILGSNQRLEVEERLAEARARQAVWLERIAAKTPSEIAADPELLRFAMVGGQAAFATNCAPCHGAGGAGQGFFPALVDDEWIWGGTMEDIEYTIRHGIRNADDPEARSSLMPPSAPTGSSTAPRSAISLSSCCTGAVALRIRLRSSVVALFTPSIAPLATARTARA